MNSTRRTFTDFRQSTWWRRIKLGAGTVLVVAGVLFVCWCIAPIREGWTKLYWGSRSAVSSVATNKQGTVLYLNDDASPDDVRSLVRAVWNQDWFRSVTHVRWESMELIPAQRDADADAVAAAFVSAAEGGFVGSMKVGDERWWNLQCGDAGRCGQATLDLVTVLLDHPRWWSGIRIDSGATYVDGDDAELLREVVTALQPWRAHLDGFYYSQDPTETGVPKAKPPRLRDELWLATTPRALTWVGLTDVDPWEAQRSITSKLDAVTAEDMVLTASEGPRIGGEGDAAPVRAFTDRIDGTLLAAATDLSYVRVETKQLSDVHAWADALDDDADIEWVPAGDADGAEATSVRVSPGALRALTPLTEQLGTRLRKLSTAPNRHGDKPEGGGAMVTFNASPDDVCGKTLDCEGIARTVKAYDKPLRIMLSLSDTRTGGPDADQLTWNNGTVTAVKMESPVTQELYRLLGGK